MGKAKEVEDVVTAESADQAVPRRIRTQGIGQRKFTTHWRKANGGQHEHTRRRRGTCFRLRPNLRTLDSAVATPQTDREGISI